MELFSFHYAGQHFVLVLDVPLQLERLVVDGKPLSVKPMGEAAGSHRFSDEVFGEGSLEFVLDPVQGKADYRLFQNDQLVADAQADLSEEAKAAIRLSAADLPKPKSETNWFVLAGGALLKLTKTFKVAKVALAAASVAVYSMMFTFEFAIALVAVLVFHEYGHLRAMQKFGIPTKGMYLIPFFGGVAVGDQPRTQWESLYISMMGPVYGLIMTAAFFVIYLVTGSHFCGLVTSVSALLNLFNLIPVFPLDGGHVVKAIIFSRRHYLSLLLFITLSALFMVLCWQHGFAFLAFFIGLGVVDLIAAWNVPLHKDMTPLKTYGIWFGLIWYLLVGLVFFGMILLIYKAGIPGSEIAIKILKS